MSVILVAVPPVDGSVQMLPCMSMASVRPSGETATDIDVPSLTVTSISGDAGAASSAAMSPIDAISTVVRPMGVLRVVRSVRLQPDPNVLITAAFYTSGLNGHAR